MPTPVVRSFLLHVATNVRTRRTAAGLSQRALAKSAGVSLRMVGGIERGSTSVSTATLDRIGIALNATLSDLVSDPAAARSQNLNRVGWIGDKGGEGILRASVEARREVEIWEWRLEPAERYQAQPDPAGWHVLLFVQEGVLTLELDTGPIDIPSGQHLFSSDQPHAFHNRGKAPVRFFRCTIW